MKKIFLYTFVFGGYDRIYPPTQDEPNVDYIIFTDDAELSVPGWQTYCVDSSRFQSPKAAAVYHMALAHRVVTGYDLSILTGGNIRRIGPLRPMMERFAKLNTAMGVYAHPVRTRIAEEADTCINDGKVHNPDLLRQQIETYQSEGFPDDIGLIETGVMLRNHNQPDLDRVAEAWWAEFERWPTRDQISLPIALWRTSVQPTLLNGSFRDEGAGFHISPHASRTDVRPFYSYVHAMSPVSLPYRLILNVWHGLWAVRRKLRTLLGE